MMNLLANNKGSFYLLCFSVRVNPSLSFHLYRHHCLQFISCQTQMSQPARPLTLEQKQYQNTGSWEDDGARRGTLGCQCQTMRGQKRRMVEILLPAVDLVRSLPWIPELSRRSPWGWQNCGSLSCFCKPMQGVQKGRGCLLTLHFWPPRAPTVSAPASNSRRDISSSLDPSLRFMPRLIHELVVGDSVWHRASASKVD